MGSDTDAVQNIALAKITEGSNFFPALEHPRMSTTVADKMLRFAGTARQVFLSRVGLPGEYSAH